MNNIGTWYLNILTGKAWTGWWDEPKEGEMMSVTSSEPLSQQSFAPWNPGEPNGDIMENCGVLMNSGAWNDIDCAGSGVNGKSCVACQIQTTPVFVMRGKYNI